MKCFLVFVILVASISSCMQAEPLFSSRTRRNAIRDRKRLWPNATVVYSIKNDFSSQELRVIKKAMNDISSVSCIRFRERTNEEAYVNIFKGDGCYSQVGYRGSQQILSLGSRCFKVKIAIHELFHALGFYHEHSRPDRDNFITVNKGNIASGMERNFNKMPFSLVTTLGLMYDYNSVMHYRYSLTPRLPGIVLKVVNEMSFLDILKVNLLYRCLR